MPADSSRNLQLDMDKLVSQHLGVAMATTGKLVVMETACASESAVRFNKYSGVAEWSNACLLWVNVGGDAYANEFYDKVLR